MSATAGKRLPTIEEYAELLSAMAEDDGRRTNKYGTITEPDRDFVFAVLTNDGRYRLMPGTEFSPRLYRGETEFHAPCKPSVYRRQKVLAKTHWHIEGLYNKTKVIELLFIMLKHPVVLSMMETRYLGHEFDFQIGPIAQHYQFKTTLLDFSRSKDVAMFFATNSYDDGTDKFTPLTSGTCALYTADLAQLIKSRGAQHPLIPMGLEPLPRPDAQKAFAVVMEPGEDLNDAPWIKCEMFEVTQQVSRHYFEMFDAGKKLFPPNPFDDYIRMIRLNGRVSMQALEWGIKIGEIPQHPYGVFGARQEFVEAGYGINDHAIDVNSDIVERAAEDWEARKTAIFDRIKCRLICDHFIGS